MEPAPPGSLRPRSAGGRRSRLRMASPSCGHCPGPDTSVTPVRGVGACCRPTGVAGRCPRRRGAAASRRLRRRGARPSCRTQIPVALAAPAVVSAGLGAPGSCLDLPTHARAGTSGDGRGRLVGGSARGLPAKATGVCVCPGRSHSMGCPGSESVPGDFTLAELLASAGVDCNGRAGRPQDEPRPLDSLLLTAHTTADGGSDAWPTLRPPGPRRATGEPDPRGRVPGRPCRCAASDIWSSPRICPE